METVINLISGAILGLAFVWFANRFSLQTKQNILAAGLIIAAIIYVVFAGLWGSLRWVSIEAAGVLFSAIFVFLAKRRRYLWLGVGWFLHPVWDIAIHYLGPGSGIAPSWYTLPCATFDLVVAAYILLSKSK